MGGLTNHVQLETRMFVLGIYSVRTLLIIYFFGIGLFRAAPTAYGGSQAKGPIQAVAASLHHSHSNVGSLTH